MEEGPEMALRRWNFVMAEGRGRLFPLSRFIFEMRVRAGLWEEVSWVEGYSRGKN